MLLRRPAPIEEIRQRNTENLGEFYEDCAGDALLAGLKGIQSQRRQLETCGEVACGHFHFEPSQQNLPSDHDVYDICHLIF